MHCALHYASIPIKRGQLEIWARFIPLPPFWRSPIISDKIFEWIFAFSFTFNIYLRDELTTHSQCIFETAENNGRTISMWGRVEHLPEKSASNILAMKKIRKIFVFFKFHFHNDGRPREKSYFEVFSRHEVIYLWVKFQVSLTCPTGFLPTNTTFFTNIWREYFSPNILRVFDQPEVEFSKSGQNWANTRPLLLKTFESSNCVDRHIVQCNMISDLRC